MEISFVSYNIWDLPILGVRRRLERIKRTAEYLTNLNTDIVCLQESFDIKNRKLLFQKLAASGYHMTDGGESRRTFLLFNLDSTGGLVIFSKFPIRQSRFVPFSRIWNSAFPEFFSRKGFLEAIVETPHGLFRVVNVHLHQQSFLFDNYMRQIQIKYLLKCLGGEYANLPGLIAGDLNQHNLAVERPLLEFFRQAGFLHPTIVAGDHMAPTYRPENPYFNSLWNFISWNWLFFRKPSRLDYFFVNGIKKIGLRVSRYEPLYFSPPLSDHDPVLLTLNKEP
ncbi:MAG TPA: endonuclease/exonuclease/phosphatase family protein [Candidatus Paceibacterota bacterium]